MRKIGDDELKNGFTIVELSLSIAFIAVLSIIVVVIISNAVSAYHRGITLNQLNTTGMDMVEDMRTTVQSSPARSTTRECTAVYNDATITNNCEKDNGLGFVFMERYADVQVGNNKVSDTPVYGAFCTGTYSYLWNSGYFFNSENRIDKVSPVNLIYQRSGGGNHNWRDENGNRSFKLLKVSDEDKAVCKVAAGADISNTRGNNGGKYKDDEMPETIDITAVSIDEEPVDLLAGNNNLAFYSLTTALPAEGGAGNMLYAVSFVLGTIQGGINVQAGGNYCATPEDYTNSSVENFDYCAINKFNFAAQATGG